MAMVESAAKPDNERFWTPETVLLLIVGVIGIVCLAVVAVRACNCTRRRKERLAQGEAKLVPHQSDKVEQDPRLVETKETSRLQSDDPVVTESRLQAFSAQHWTKCKRYVADKIKDVKRFVVKCLNESSPVKAPDEPGRRQSDVHMVQFERAVLYQLCHPTSSQNNACTRSFLRVKNGYASARCVNGYWSEHMCEVAELRKSLITQATEQGLTLKALYEAHYNLNKDLLQEIRS